MPVRIVSAAVNQQLVPNSSLATEDDIHSGAVHEFHTGHVQKPKYAATTGPLDRIETSPIPAQQIQVRQVYVAPQSAGFYVISPPVTHWVQKYTRTVQYYS